MDRTRTAPSRRLRTGQGQGQEQCAAAAETGQGQDRRAAAAETGQGKREVVTGCFYSRRGTNKLLREEGKERKKWVTAPFKDIRRSLGITPHSILPLGVTPHFFLPHSRSQVAGTRRDTPVAPARDVPSCDHSALSPLFPPLDDLPQDHLIV